MKQLQNAQFWFFDGVDSGAGIQICIDRSL